MADGEREGGQMVRVSLEQARMVGRGDIDVGTEVEVRRRFDSAWARGFQVCEVTDAGYRLRRHSDGAVLPVAFPVGDLRPAALD